ncbi:MAG: YqgE/AlgH family protein [Thermoanaerobaculia bacterium]
MVAATLEPPVLLVAMPQVLDPFFHKSVVLLLHHDEQGSFGLIINRTTGIQVAEILRGMEISWAGPDDALAFFGGPVQPQLGTVLYAAAAQAEVEEANSTEIRPGLRMSQHMTELTALAERPPGFFRLVLGYAGWGEGQLLDEILRHDWLPVPIAEDLLYATPADELWTAALRSVEVDPDALPAWTPGADEETTN